MNWNALPNELILAQLLQLSIADILKLCQVNRNVAALCESQILWIELLRRDYPDVDLTLEQDPHWRYRQEHLIQYMIASAGPDPRDYDFESFKDFEEAQRGFVYNMSFEDLEALEIIRNEVVPISAVHSLNKEVSKVHGFVFDNFHNLIFTSYGPSSGEFLILQTSDPTLRSRQDELLSYVQNLFVTSLGFESYDEFINIQQRVIYNLNAEQLDLFDFIIEEVLPYSVILTHGTHHTYVVDMHGFVFKLYQDNVAEIIFV